MGGQGRWPVLSDPTDEELLQLKLQKKFMLVLTERCQNTPCSTVGCVWGCIATDHYNVWFFPSKRSTGFSFHAPRIS